MGDVCKTVFNRRPGGGLLLVAAFAGFFAASAAEARCWNKTTHDNGQGNQSPLIRTDAQVSGGANIGTYQPVSNDTIICDNDTTPVPSLPGTPLNPLNATTQVFAKSGPPGSLNGIPGFRPTENVTVHLTEGFITSTFAVLSLINISYASTVTIDEGATIQIATGTSGFTWAVGLMHGGSATTITNNGTISTLGRNSVGISIGATQDIAKTASNTYVNNTGLVVPSANNTVVNNGTISTGGINASGIQALNSACLSITNNGSITATGITRPDNLTDANMSATMAAGILIDNTPPFTGSKPSDPPGVAIGGFPAIIATNDIFAHPINPDLYDLYSACASNSMIVNTGAISANTGSAIEVRADKVTVTNTSTLTSAQSAAVHFGKNTYDLAAGDNTLILDSGSVLNGDVVSESAGNTLKLQGTVTEESNLGVGMVGVGNGGNQTNSFLVPTPNQGIGFEWVKVNGDWTMTGNKTTATDTGQAIVESGRLTLINNAQVKAGTMTVAAGATLKGSLSNIGPTIATPNAPRTDNVIAANAFKLKGTLDIAGDSPAGDSSGAGFSTFYVTAPSADLDGGTLKINLCASPGTQMSDVLDLSGVVSTQTVTSNVTWDITNIAGCTTATKETTGTGILVVQMDQPNHLFPDGVIIPITNTVTEEVVSYGLVQSNSSWYLQVVTPDIAPAGFNAFESYTPAGAVTGLIDTKVGGVAGNDVWKLDLVAIRQGDNGPEVDPNFKEKVKYEWVAFDGLAYPDDCKTAPVVIATVAETAAFDNGRLAGAAIAPLGDAVAARDVRARISYPPDAPTVVSCSTDNFAIRPAYFTVASNDATQTTTVGGPVFKAGLADTGGYFDLRALARGASGGLASGGGSLAGYTGTPLIDNEKVRGTGVCGDNASLPLPATCVLDDHVTSGTASDFGPAAAGTATAARQTFTWDEAGLFWFQQYAVYDTTWTAVDQANGGCAADDFSWLSTATTATAKNGCNIGNKDKSTNIGRFIPAHFQVTVNNACGNFTYSGQPFTSVRIEAHNGKHDITRNYNANGGVARDVELFDAEHEAAPIGTFSSIVQISNNIVPTTSNVSGSGSSRITLARVNFNTLFDYVLGQTDRGVAGFGGYSGVTPPALLFSFNNKLTAPTNIRLRAVEKSGGNPPGDGVTSDPAAGGEEDFPIPIRSGRLRLFNGFIDTAKVIHVPMQVEYWDGGQWLLNSDDSCTKIETNMLYLSHNDQPLPATVANPAEAKATLSGGQGQITLPFKQAGVMNRVDDRFFLTVNLGLIFATNPGVANAGLTAVDTSCLLSHGGASSYGNILPWLRAQNPFGANNPTATCNDPVSWDHDPWSQISFGVNDKRMIHIREMFR
ncbi:MAG: hypothetical protein LBE62_07630 [Azonexus sp.]|jgi:hypothetical protein|nr:hypothetical protein [Azonexus sp.]